MFIVYRFPNAGVNMARQMRDRRRLAIAVLIIITSFALCWGTFFAYFMTIHFGNAPQALKKASTVLPIVNTCLDPWLLFAISSNHRACLTNCLHACRPRWPAERSRGAPSTSQLVERCTRTGSTPISHDSADTNNI